MMLHQPVKMIYLLLLTDCVNAVILGSNVGLILSIAAHSV